MKGRVFYAAYGLERNCRLDSSRHIRFNAINTFIAKASRCLSYLDENSVMDLGEAYHCIYQYVPDSFWDDLDELYAVLVAYKWDKAKELYPPIVRRLSAILKETPRLDP